MNYKDIYEKWGIPYIEIGSGILIESFMAADVIDQIYENDFNFLGYDAFVVLSDGKRQPKMEYCENHGNKYRSNFEAINSFNDHSSDVTHYEFVFRPKA